MRSYRQAIAVALATFVASLLGMNVGGIPLSQHSHGFALVVSALTLTTGVLAYFVLIRRRD